MPGAYWPQPWTCEDGSPTAATAARTGSKGLGIGTDERLEVVASVDALATDMLLRREPGELYALRHEIPYDGAQGRPLHGWVERRDPITLEVLASSARLPGGPYWPGGIAAHASRDLHMVYGHWAHRLSPGLDVLASHRLPVERPHNSFVVLDGGELVMKDCDAPAGLEPSTLSVLDPHTLLPVAPPLRLAEPSIARLSSDGESVIALGSTVAYRLRLNRHAGRLLIDDSWQPSYGPAGGRSYGWDPVITDRHVLWMDNGRNRVDRTMLGSGSSPDPVRLWWARRDDARRRCVPSRSPGLPFGTESNPPSVASRAQRGHRLRRRQRRAAGVAADRRRTRATLATRPIRACRASDHLHRYTRAGRTGFLGHPRHAPPGRPTARSHRPYIRSPDRLVSVAPRLRPDTTSSSCSISTPEPTRRVSTSHPQARHSSSPPRASPATSTISPSRRSHASPSSSAEPGGRRWSAGRCQASPAGWAIR